MESFIPASDRDAHVLHIQLNTAMMVHDMKAVSRAMHDLAGIGYSIQIMTRHVAKKGGSAGDNLFLDKAQHDCQWHEAYSYYSEIPEDIGSS